MIAVVDQLLNIIQLLILVRILYSWIDQNPYPTNVVKKFLWAVTDPILEPLRRVIPPLGMFDISPLAAIFLIELVRYLARAALDPYGIGGF